MTLDNPTSAVLLNAHKNSNHQLEIPLQIGHSDQSQQIWKTSFHRSPTSDILNPKRIPFAGTQDPTQETYTQTIDEGTNEYLHTSTNGDHLPCLPRHHFAQQHLTTMKMNQAYTLLPWKKPGLADNEYATSVKWQQNNSKYEIYSTTLEDMDVDKVVQHCLDVKGKIRKEVSNNNHLGPGYFKAFPRTLSVPLMAVWDTVIAAWCCHLAGQQTCCILLSQAKCCSTQLHCG